MTLLALDLGTNMGYAISSKGTVVSGSVSFKPGKFDGGGMRPLKFHRWLDDLHKTSVVTEVAFEAVRRHLGTDAAHIYGALMGVLTMWCEANKVPYEGVSVQAIKMFATGKGNAGKEAVTAAVKKRWGHNPKTDDEADALALLHLKLNEIWN